MWHSETRIIQYAYSYSTLLESGLHGACQSKSRHGPKSQLRVVTHAYRAYLFEEFDCNCCCERTCRTVEECGTWIPMVCNQRERGKVTDLQLPSIPLEVSTTIRRYRTIDMGRAATPSIHSDTCCDIFGVLCSSLRSPDE